MSTQYDFSTRASTNLGDLFEIAKLHFLFCNLVKIILASHSCENYMNMCIRFYTWYSMCQIIYKYSINVSHGFSVTRSCLTLCDPLGYSPAVSFVCGISQARILKRVAISSFRGSFQPRDWTWVSCVSCIVRQILYYCATGKVSYIGIYY